MKSSIHPLLDQWLKLFNHFPQNDPLVDLDNTFTVPFNEKLNWTNVELQKIINTANESLKSFGTNPLTIVQGRITQIAHQKTNIPFLLYETDFKIEKINHQVICSKREEKPIINPFLIQLLQKNYDLVLKEEDWFDSEKLFAQNIVVEEVDKQWIGNFHPNRYALRNELTQIIAAGQISCALQEQLDLHEKRQEELVYDAADLVLLDDDQISVIKQFEKRNLVVEGPPGTGKTQLLIYLIGKNLSAEHSTLVCSAKQTALNVLEKRLKALKLDSYIFKINDSNGLQPIYQSLAEQWQKIEQFKPSPITNEYRKQREDQLQFKLDIWNQPRLIGEGSWLAFKKLTEKYSIEEGKWISNTLTLQELQANEELLKQIYRNKWNYFIYGISNLLYHNSYEEIGNKLESITPFINNLPADSTATYLKDLEKKQITFQLFNSNFALENEVLLDPKSKKRCELIKRINRLEKSEKELICLQQETAQWKMQISTLELNYFITELNSKNWFKNLKLKYQWKKLSKSPYTLATELIKNELRLRKVRENHDKIILQLSKYNITNSKDAQLFSLQLNTYTEIQWEHYQTISKAEKNLFREWTQGNVQLIKKTLDFNWQSEIPIAIQLKNWLEVYQEMALKSKKILAAPSNLSKSLVHATTSNLYMANQLKTHWINFQAHYPELAELQTKGIEDAIHLILSESDREQTHVIDKIYLHTKKKFDHYHQILATANNQLSEENKILKQTLKRGKAILIREFNKQKQHLKLHSLLNSEAKLWIDLLQPVHFSNPIQLATHCSLQKEMYKIAIIDEASQILASHSAGILYRSQHVIIAGDEKQMQPKTFFQSNEDQESLMNRAKFVLPSLKLKHHYRSQHTDLIEFSNQHFYENELTIFPKQNAEKAIHHTYVNGRFIERKNEEEATAIVELIESTIEKSNSLGVVAFSQNQIDLIRKKINPTLLDRLIEREEAGTFFLLPLEKIQGDECEDLIIGTTYGPDEQGKIRQQFGLLSLDGGLNRLNVLATRASKTIHLITSLKSSDIQMTTNPNTSKFGLWINYITQKASAKGLSDKKDTICIPLHESLSLREILIQTTVYKKRGWKVKYA